MRNPFKPQEATRAYWWTGVPNFGDALAPLLLDHFGDIHAQWAPVSHAQIASIGSILEHIPPLWDGYILGSGRLLENSVLQIAQMGRITPKILALRGPLTARGIRGDYALGDPGILADEIVGPQQKIWDLGIVPHWRDTELAPRFTDLVKPPWTSKVINPQDDPLEILRQIGACHRIVTSSLHGMIVADAFGIPRRVEICPRLAREGGDFKFRDYSASIRMPFEEGKMAEASRFRVEDVKFAIYDAYRELERALRKCTSEE